LFKISAFDFLAALFFFFIAVADFFALDEEEVEEDATLFFHFVGIALSGFVSMTACFEPPSVAKTDDPTLPVPLITVAAPTINIVVAANTPPTLKKVDFFLGGRADCVFPDRSDS